MTTTDYVPPFLPSSLPPPPALPNVNSNRYHPIITPVCSYIAFLLRLQFGNSILIPM